MSFNGFMCYINLQYINAHPMNTKIDFQILKNTLNVV
jgi:hypothetical protein